jgi:hypothetical protein
MSRHILILIALLAAAAHADDAPKQQAKAPAKQEKQSKQTKPAAAAEETKTLSGISILGNQEAPKSLVIVPWKSSEIGDAPGLSRLLDDSTRPVDKEVFMRELDYYEIRSGAK